MPRQVIDCAPSTFESIVFSQFSSNRYIYTKIESSVCGLQIEYDENGNNFWYFIVPVYVSILLPVTFCLWPNTEENETEPHPIYRFNFAPNSDELNQ